MRLTIRKPDDWHLHLRDGAMLKAVMPFTAKHFGRAILMPNLVPPVMTTKDAVAYRERALAARPPGSTFTPLMTCYLRDDTDPDDVERGFRDAVFAGVKLYPAHATTNSAAGVTDIKKTYRVLERMEKIDMPFLMHGEEVDPDVDIFDREAAFIERKLIPLTRSFPGLRMILEHLSSKEGVDFVRIRWRARSTSTVCPACSIRRWRSRPMPGCSRRRAHSTSSKPSPPSMAPPITRCR